VWGCIWSSGLILVLSVVSIITYISCFMCMLFIAVHKFSRCVFFTATRFKMPEQEIIEHTTTRWHGPMYPHCSTNSTRMQSFATCYRAPTFTFFHPCLESATMRDWTRKRMALMLRMDPRHIPDEWNQFPQFHFWPPR
jgi:hypothetical protein